MKKVLMLANTASMILQFNLRNIDLFKNLGYEVNLACNFKNGNTCGQDVISKFQKKLEEQKISYYQIDFGRNVKNVFTLSSAYNQVKKIVKENDYDLIFCQSTVAGIFGRLLANNFNIKVIYIVHGFQFYKGASKLRWLIFYNLERRLSKKTDILILTNKEDYKIAIEKFHSKFTYFVPGVGVELSKYIRNKEEGLLIREELGIKQDDFLIISAGELSERKNHRRIINAIKNINNSKIKFILCGIGPLETEYRGLIKEYNLENSVFLLGYREDLVNIYSAADLFCFPSFYEGLPVSLMIAMATKTPIICSKIRGNTDLIVDETYMFNPFNQKEIEEKIKFMMTTETQASVEENYKNVFNFSNIEVDKKMNDIFSQC